MSAEDETDLPRLAAGPDQGAPRTVDYNGNPVDVFRAVVPVGYTTIFEDPLTEVPETAAGIVVSCRAKHQPVPKTCDQILVDCYDKDGVRITCYQVNRTATVIIVAIDWERKAFRVATDSDPAEVAKFRADAQVYDKVLAFQKVDQRHQVPSQRQMLQDTYTQIPEVPEITYSNGYSRNERNGTFWKVEEGWIYMNNGAWDDFLSKILGTVLDPAADRTFALSLHRYSSTYIYPKTWTHPTNQGVLENHRLKVCSEEEWARGQYDPPGVEPTQLRPGTRFVRLGFIINHWSGNPATKPDAQGWTEDAAPFIWKDVQITTY